MISLRPSSKVAILRAIILGTLVIIVWLSSNEAEGGGAWSPSTDLTGISDD